MHITIENITIFFTYQARLTAARIERSLGLSGDPL